MDDAVVDDELGELKKGMRVNVKETWVEFIPQKGCTPRREKQSIRK